MRQRVEEYVPSGFEPVRERREDAQPSLFDPPRIARGSDPDTSHRAAQQITRSGYRASLNQIVLRFLRGADRPLTYREIGAGIGQEAVGVMRRLNDLRQRGLVEKCGERNCSTNGNAMTLWRAVAR